MDGVQLVEDCCSILHLPDLICTRSRMVLQEWIEMDLTTKCKDKSLLTACAIYTAMVEYRTEMESPSEQGLRCTLLQILRAANVNLKLFLDFMKVIGKKYHSETMKEYIQAIQRKYVIAIGIYNTFDRLMNLIFEASGQKDPFSSNYRRRVCWCLFLVAKVTMLPENSELVSPLHLMLCCLDYIVKQSPLFMLREPFRAANSVERQQQDSSSGLRAINTAFATYSDIDELESAQANLFNPFMQDLPQEVLIQTADGLPKLTYFESKYKTEYEASADIDEMAFLDNDPILIPMKERAPSPDSTITNEAVPPIPQTPVRDSIKTAQSLKTLLANATDRPSPNLLSLLNGYGEHLVKQVTDRTEQLKNQFVEPYIKGHGQTIAQTRYRLGVRLYYREMEHIITRERERQVAVNSIVSLLSDDLFHRCLLACSLEVVKVYYEYMGASPNQESSIGNGGLDFPWILTILNIHSYDFLRVIETFIREERQLSEQAIRHLTNVEQFILECDAWKEGSPFLVALRASLISKSKQSSQNEASSSKEPILQHHLTPSKSHVVLSTGEATPPPKIQPSPPVVTRIMLNSPGPSMVASSSQSKEDIFLTKFLMKVEQLGYKRLEELTRALELQGEIKHRIWTCLERCLMKIPDLLEGRHLDQIIMCCIYAICKIAGARNSRQLKRIAAVYQTLPHSVSSTYKHVRIVDDNYGHIIKFYNEVFVPAMKDYIFKFQQVGPSSPVPIRSPSTPNHQKSYKVHPNLTVSPLRCSPFKSPGRQRHPGSLAPVTPRTALLLNTGEDFNSEKMERFNKQYGTASKRRHEERQGPAKHKSKVSKRLDVDGSTTEDNMQPSGVDTGNNSDTTRMLQSRLTDSPPGAPRKEDQEVSNGNQTTTTASSKENQSQLNGHNNPS